MKKKIFSVILSICLFFGGLFSFSGCSLVSTDKDKVNDNVVMKIGDESITQADLINAFYTYYQNNSSYFSYYDSDTIEESFYTWFTVKTMVDQLSTKALYNSSTNPEGYIYYTAEDAETVWESVEDYFYSQVTSYEEALYEADSSIDEDDYPVWLQDEEDDEEESGFEIYTSPLEEVEIGSRTIADAVEKLTEAQVYEKIDALKENLFKYVVSTDDDGNETKADISSEYLTKRNQAYTNYIQGLISNAKANSSSTKTEDVLKAEVLRIYEAYYKSQISVIFQEYFTQDVLLDETSDTYKNLLGDGAIVSAFLDKYFADVQTYQIQDSYVTKMESSDGASLLLYNYQGKYYYFSVQHILVKFSDYLSEQVTDIYGSSTSKAGSHIGDSYVSARDNLATTYKNAMLSTINTDAEKDSIVTVGDYYYYDEDKSEVWDSVNGIYYGYVKLSTHTYDPATKSVSYVYKTYTTAGGEDITYSVDANGVVTFSSNEVVLMANVDDILNAYDYNYSIWFDLAEDVFNGTKTVDETIALENGKYESIKYVFETAKNMKDNGNTLDELRNKVASYLFIELEWIYSADSLDNETSNKIGYIISSEPDNNMNWMVDFVTGAQDIIEYMDTPAYAALTADEKAIYTKTVVSDYGYHIIKVEDVFDADHKSIIDMSSVTATYSLENGSDYVNQVVALLKKTYICSTSNETLYDYIFDEIYENLVGSSSSSGSYFLALEYQWLSDFYQDNKIETIKKLTYDELVDSLS